MKNQARVTRWSSALKIIRPKLVAAIKSNQMSRAETLLTRLNSVCRDQRKTNLKNGMPGETFVDYQLNQVIADIKSKNL